MKKEQNNEACFLPAKSTLDPTYLNVVSRFFPPNWLSSTLDKRNVVSLNHMTLILQKWEI